MGMSEEHLVKYPDPILTTPCDPFDFDNPLGDPSELSVALIKLMNDYKAIGLAANQVGIPYRVFVMKGYPENFVCFNPKIINHSNETELLDEACLSFPGVNVKVKRSKEIRVRFQTPSGETATMNFSGLTARVFQHELDHLDGKLFFNRANRYHRDKALKGFHNVKRS
jgi:peptide deformylase